MLTETPTSAPVVKPTDSIGTARRRPDDLGTIVSVGVAWVVLLAVSVIHRPDFWSHQTLLSITFSMSIIGVLCVAQSIVALSGGILDLSIPTALVLPAFLIDTLLARHWNGWLIVAIALSAGAAWGLLNAGIIVTGKLNPVIVTLATNFAGIALLQIMFQHTQTTLDSGIANFGAGYFWGLPNVFWPMIIIIFLAGGAMRYTRYGRHAVGVGGNPAAAKARGISLRKTRIAIFTTAGALGGFAAVLYTSSTSNLTPMDGATYLLPVIAASILAGVSLQGGRGNLWLLVLSVGFLSTVPTSLVFFGLSDNYQQVLQGAILIVAVSVDGYRRKRRAQ